MIEFEDEGFKYAVTRCSSRGREINDFTSFVASAMTGNEFNIDIRLTSPTNQIIRVTSVCISVSKAFALIKLFSGSEKMNRPADFLRVLFGEAKALSGMV